MTKRPFHVTTFVGGTVTADLQASGGYVEVRGGRVWYQMVGDGLKIPLVTVHGGPGARMTIWYRWRLWPTSGRSCFMTSLVPGSRMSLKT